jgi:hypothetical protein
VLQDHLRPVTPGRPVLQARQQHHRHSDQPVPAQLRAPQRRLVRPGAPPLRHGAAGVGAHRRLPGRRRPGLLPAGQVLAQRRRALQHRRLQLLPARQHPEPRRQRLSDRGLGQGRQDGLDPDVQELGRQLAGALRARRPEPQLRRDQHRRAVHSVPERRPELVAVRHGLHHQQEFRPLAKPCASSIVLFISFASNSGCCCVEWRVRALDFHGAFYALVPLHPSWPPEWLVSYVMLRLQEEIARVFGMLHRPY